MQASSEHFQKTVKPSRLQPSASLTFFILGFFALIAQTLLFREAFQVYEGSEIGIGIFFGTWMLWVALGAYCSKLIQIPTALMRLPECLPLAYIPAYFLEIYGLSHAREMSGVLAYEVFPYGAMFFSSLLVLAPLSFVTGLLFALVCRIFQDRDSRIVARVYILESLGAFTGGIWVTLALYLGIADATLLLTCLPCLTGALVWRFFDRSPIQMSGLLILFFLPLLCGLDKNLDQNYQNRLWQQYLQGSKPEGGFRTASGLYLYGQIQDQFNVLDRGGTLETLPSPTQVAETLGTVLAQRPAARDFLVMGNQGLSLGGALLALVQSRRVALLHGDPQFYSKLTEALGGRLVDPVLHILQKVEILQGEPRKILGTQKQSFDLIFLNLSDPDTAVSNRNFSQEFFKILKASLRPGGLLAIRVSGGENYLGEELAYLGASTQATLESVFKETVLKAGEDSWFLASDGGDLSESPALLRDRIQSVNGIKSILNPQLLMSLYLPDRIEFQRKKYQVIRKREGDSRLISTDGFPFAHLFALLHSSKQSMSGYSRVMKVLSSLASWPFWMALILFALTRLWFLAQNRLGEPGLSSYDCFFMLLTTGVAGISYQTLLMFVFQTWHGSLFLYVGLISSLFMLGLTLGAFTLEKILISGLSQARILLVLVFGHLGFCLLTGWVAGNGNPALLILCFLLAGVLTGAAFPLGESALHRLGAPVGLSASRLEAWDHLGGALGGILTGMILLPLLGVVSTLALLGGLMLLNLLNFIPFFRDKRDPLLRKAVDRRLRIASYFLAYFGILSLGGAWLFTLEKERRSGEHFLEIALSLCAEMDHKMNPYPQDSGRYVTAFKSGEHEGMVQAYIVDSQGLSPRIKSYGGGLELSLRMDMKGRIEALVVVDSHDTPSYLQRVVKWMRAFVGISVFSQNSLQEVEGVSGATITAEAVRKGIFRIGSRFSTQVLGRENSAREHSIQGGEKLSLPEMSSLVLVLFVILSLILRQFPRKNLRIFFLLGTTIFLGLSFNLQFSSQQIFSLVFLRIPELGWNHAFLLVVGMPLLVFCFGNIYCGYLCPFGALQELLGNLRPGNDSTAPSKEIWKLARGVKYLLLFLLVILYSLTGESRFLNADPLVTFFSGEMSLRVFGFSTLLLMVSFFYRRFYCRNLCPAGAFFSLLNRVRLFKAAIPAVKIGKCDLGVLKKKDLDCICCDRCR
jgi:predicted membrane-bound spermidine synthase